ncbi:hypothetical protein [Olivibacter domesticus]|uniref:hypothetical protein n=1 Tax=Olivibacter domesticus TaxID=407022 RepID=UPI0011143186|nr:hypothetical protein [Olivibacter domesticus]
MNNLITYKTYTFHTIPIQVVFEEGIIRITNDLQLWIFYDQHIIERTVWLVNRIKQDYNEFFGKPLAISNRSLGLEIWGHLYYEVFILRFSKLFRLDIRSRRMKNLLKPAQIIDCGESDKDSNRRLWNLLAPLFSFIGKLLPLNISKIGLKD